MASHDANPTLRTSGETVPDNATSGHDARPLDLHPGHRPSPRPRLKELLELPQRHIWGKGRRERTEDTPVDCTVQYLEARYKAEHHIADIQARLDAAERAS